MPAAALRLFSPRPRARRLLVIALTALGVAVGSVAASAATANVDAPSATNGGAVRVTVHAAAAGTALVEGARIATAPAALTCSVTATFAEAGAKTLLCGPNAATRKMLRLGAVRVRVKVVFTPTGGSAETTRLGVVVLPRTAAPSPSPAPSVVTG